MTQVFILCADHDISYLFFIKRSFSAPKVSGFTCNYCTVLGQQVESETLAAENHLCSGTPYFTHLRVYGSCQ